LRLLAIFATEMQSYGCDTDAFDAIRRKGHSIITTRWDGFVPARCLCAAGAAATGAVMSSKTSILVSRTDMERIEALLDRQPAADAASFAKLRAELDRADVAESAAMPADTVGMNSTVTFEDEQNGEKLTLTLVYPAAAGATGTVSILAPVGSALLGLSIGQDINWPMPDGRLRKLRVLEVTAAAPPAAQ
jgi:regulator of nucleoside diphosphate kinase